MSIQIIPFQSELLTQAAELLALRHSNDRAVFPELPCRLQDRPAAEQTIQAVLQRPHAAGYAAMDSGQLAAGQLVAYLIGDLVIDSTWGRSGWIRQPGCAYDPAVGGGIVRELYAALGARWVDWGVLTHLVLAPAANPALIQTWFSLGFGVEQVHGLADLDTLDPVLPDIPPGIEIRRAGSADRH
ncbi:MAG: hypothetical protein JXA42_23045, partial [Anaerolineales bacterium]|nr:hypothetical protein [Anaerolineales bacterium]